MIEIPVFLLICAPALYKLLPFPYVGSILGPIAVILENTAVVLGDKVDPLPSLSDSKASDVEISAIAESLNTIPN